MRWVWLLLITAFLLLALLPATGATEQPLTNEDIIALSKAGLSDSAIIVTIGRSRPQFELSASALVKLKQAGVSNAVIEAMLGARPAAPSEGGASSRTAPSTPPAAAGPLPSAYGYYVLDGVELQPLEPVPVVTRMGLQPGGLVPGNPGHGVDGFSGEPPITISTQMPSIIVYQQALDVGALRMSMLEFTRTMHAYQFNVLGTDRQFFSTVYGGMTPETEIAVNLWRPKDATRIRVEPVEGKPGMFRLSPGSPLASGRYALWLGSALHPIGTVFAATSERRASAYYFGVGASPSSITSQSTGAPGRPDIVALTRNIPGSDYFQSQERTFSVGFDKVWAAAEQVFARTSLLKRQADKVMTADKDKGVLITAPTVHSRLLGESFKRQFLVVIEPVGENATKVTVKGLCYDRREAEWVPWDSTQCNRMFFQELETGLKREG